MKYLFDSSAIFRAIKENRVEVLAGNCTLELAQDLSWETSYGKNTLSKRESQKKNQK